VAQVLNLGFTINEYLAVYDNSVKVCFAITICKQKADFGSVVNQSPDATSKPKLEQVFGACIRVCIILNFEMAFLITSDEINVYLKIRLLVLYDSF